MMAIGATKTTGVVDDNGNSATTTLTVAADVNFYFFVIFNYEK